MTKKKPKKLTRRERELTSHYISQEYESPRFKHADFIGLQAVNFSLRINFQKPRRGNSIAAADINYSVGGLHIFIQLFKHRINHHF